MLNRMISRYIIDGTDNTAALAEALQTFQVAGGTPNAATLATIQALSAHNFERIKKILADLDDMGLLNNETVAIAVQRVTQKIASMPESTIVKTKHAQRKEIRLDGKTSFFLDPGASHNADGHGGQANVNKGYMSMDAVSPTKSVKRFCKPDDEYALSKETLARRETKYLEFMGRHAHRYLSKKGPVVVADWQHGECVSDISEIDLTTISITRRLQWLVCGLNDIEELHENFRIHADIKPENFILNIANDTMKLIDFGSAQKIGSTKELAASPMYVDMKEGKPHKAGSDMFSMGYVVAAIFPELFDIYATMKQYLLVSPSGNRHKIIQQMNFPAGIEKKKAVKNTDIALIALLDAMMEAAAEDRCTNQQALLFCNNLSSMLAIKKDIDDQDLAMLLGGSINRNVYEVEDALRGSKRPAKFGAVKAGHVPQPKHVAPAAVLFTPVKEQPATTAPDANKKNDNNARSKGCTIQ